MHFNTIFMHTVRPVSAFLVGICVSGGAAAQSGDGWRHVRTIGMIDMVVVDAKYAKDKDKYRTAVAGVCKSKPSFCKVLVWNNERLVPTAMPMTGAQAAALRANWTYNGKTGVRSFLVACDIDPNPNECFNP